MLSITIENIPFVTNIVALAIVLVTVLFKTYNYRRLCFIEYAGIALITIIFVLCKSFLAPHYLIWETIISAIAICLCVYSIYDLFKREGMRKAFVERANQMVKNAPFDYYFLTNKDDLIKECSESFTKLVGLPEEELFNTLGLQTIMSKLFITHINGNEITSGLAVRLSVDYNGIQGTKNNYHFNLTYVQDHEEIELLVLVEPIFYKNEFVGRNVYISSNNKQSLERVQNGLEKALNVIQDDRAQLYAMMSMEENVVMYYDYNTSSFVVTEAMAKYLGLVQREFAINEYISMIHPQDLRRYQDQSSIISSVEVTRMTYRLMLGKQYYNVHEDAMYLNRDSKLISIIHLADYVKQNNYTEEVVEEQEYVASNVPPKEVDYKEKLTDTIKVLEKILEE